jgi:hypothetical protein
MWNQEDAAERCREMQKNAERIWEIRGQVGFLYNKGCYIR